MEIPTESVHPKISIVVLSFDGYRDVWPFFFEAFYKYWPDCEYPIYLVNNETEVNYKNVHLIQTGKEINWCNRARKAIEQIDSDYVLLLLEDYLIGEKVKNSDLNQAMNFIVNNNVNYLRITNIPRKRAIKENSDQIYPIYKNEEYGVNLQASVWKKDFLLAKLKEVDGSAWEFEINFLKEAVDGNKEPLDDCFVSTANIIDIHNGILKGKWFPKTIRYFRKRGINIDYQYRGKLSIKEVISHNVRFYLRENIPNSLRKTIKKLLLKMGVKFVSQY
ncbi:hypothetical protein CN378_12545 [Bacillus sp. AFS015802]|uniref:hypothetical protein n=1 Tax=Bacillus sp. AFS015802 TaxID=2033486 RepID=UPI000BF7C261|nr:hypothetical protein [Bacillus sp. AFS015802]PFA66932.1 hypothetical protein CN378_12545 [Bacillus sp. AFS015802]